MEGGRKEGRGWGDTTEERESERERGREKKKRKAHQQGVGWMRGDREQEDSGSRNIKGPIQRSGVCTKSASGM